LDVIFARVGNKFLGSTQETGETGDVKLVHEEEGAEKFYGQFPAGTDRHGGYWKLSVVFGVAGETGT